MDKQNVKARISCLKDKSKLTVILYMTKEQRELFLVEKGSQPTMYEVFVKEVQ